MAVQKVATQVIEDAAVTDAKLNTTGTMPAWNGSALTNLPAANLTGTIADARLPDPLPAISGASLTNLPSHSGNVAFPATQVASADANTLDDYEEGTWTPTITRTGGTYANQGGRYTKIGRNVTCDFFLQSSVAHTYTSGTDYFTMEGLPFAPSGWGYDGPTGSFWSQTFNFNNSAGSNNQDNCCPVAKSSAEILFRVSDSGASSGTVQNNNNSGFIITGQVIYQV